MFSTTTATIWLLMALSTGTNITNDIALSFTTILGAFPTEALCLGQVASARKLSKARFPTLIINLRCRPTTLFPAAKDTPTPPSQGAQPPVQPAT